MHDLEGRTAVITGGAGGIGLGLAHRLATEGVNVVVADVDELALDQAVRGLRADGAKAIGVVTDVADAQSTEELAAAASAEFGSVELLFCNAGIAGYSKGSLWETPACEWQRVIGVNTFGITNTIGAFLPSMLASGGDGHVVITASMAAFARGPVAAGYFASKHAALSIAESLRLQLEAANAAIGVSVLCPSAVSTGILVREVAHQRSLGADLTPEEEAAWVSRLSESTPGVLTPDEVADIVVAAIRERRFYIFTHESSVDMALERTQSLLDELASARLS